jgi:NADH:ubiquinone oxidoreductase subunit 5 (subunit L)/multisubunit Na+/H+ antiporter MnhA subunit
MTKSTFKEPKSPKTVQVKMLVPYSIIIFLALVAGSLIAGWFIRSDFDSTIRSQVTSQVQELTSKE